MRTRPIGITILALLFGLNAAVYLAFTALAIFNHDALVAVLRRLSPSGAGPEAIHTAMGRLQPFYYFAMAALTAAMAAGFWKLRNWARVIMLALIALSLVLMVTEVRPLLAAPTTAAVVLTLVRVALSVLWVWYLLRRQVRHAFQQKPMGGP